MGAATHNTSALQSVKDAVASQGTFFRKAASKAPTTLGDIGSTISSTLTDAPKSVGEKILATPSNILNIPVAQGVSLPGLGKALQKGDVDDLSKSLQSITGVKLRGATGLLPNTSQVNIEKRVNDYMAAVKTQLLNEIKNCIQKCLNEILINNPNLAILLDLEGYIQRRISKYRLELQRKIRSEIEKLANEKLKLWQIALIKQKILEYTRKACPCSGNKKDHSPTYIKRLQDDDTWKLVDGSTDVEVLLNSSASAGAWSDSANNTARHIDSILADTISQLTTDSAIQAMGYTTTEWSDFVSSDGSINSTYTNSNGASIDSTDPYVNSIKRLEICDDD
jgi:hypothetical protein